MVNAARTLNTYSYWWWPSGSGARARDAAF